MLPPKNVPTDSSTIHPWIFELLNADKEFVTIAIRKRIEGHPLFESTAPLSNWIVKYQPRQIVFRGLTGYVGCIKIENDAIVDMIYLPQPLSKREIAERVSYFRDDVQPLMTDFFTRFSGIGQEMEGVAGQFSFRHFPSASEFAYYEPERLGEWKSSRLFYSAQNGDSIFVNGHGATAWFVRETSDLIPMFDELAGFINHFVGFRTAGTDIFDSWSSRKFLKQ